MQNAFVESFNGRLRDEFLNETLFTSLMQARLALEDWRCDYNNVRPHSRIGWLAPAVYAANFSPHQAKALRSLTAPPLGPLLQLCKMATARLSGQLDKGRGQRHEYCHLRATLAALGAINRSKAKSWSDWKYTISGSDREWRPKMPGLLHLLRPPQNFCLLGTHSCRQW